MWNILDKSRMHPYWYSGFLNYTLLHNIKLAEKSQMLTCKHKCSTKFVNEFAYDIEYYIDGLVQDWRLHN